MQETQITDAEFNQLRGFVKHHFGISLSDKKKKMVIGRLQRVLRNGGFASFKAYFDAELKNPSKDALQLLANRISTNYTYFNREPEHFDFLHSHIYPWIRAKNRGESRKRLRMWCAASSTGQEPYMLAITQHEYFGPDLRQWDAGLLATDISENALAAARSGVYDAEEVEPLPVVLRKKYMQQEVNGDFSVKPNVKRDVTFRKFNLMTPVFPFKTRFDVIFCRNVMIYFEAETRTEVVGRMHQHLMPEGYLVISQSESLGRAGHLFHYIQPGVYRRK